LQEKSEPSRTDSVYRESAVTRRAERRRGAVAFVATVHPATQVAGGSGGEEAARARPPSTSSGTGTDDGPDVSVWRTRPSMYVSVAIVDVGLVGGVSFVRVVDVFRARGAGRARRGVTAARVRLALLRERERRPISSFAFE
jgi:hypothetical protein